MRGQRALRGGGRIGALVLGLLVPLLAAASADRDRGVLLELDRDAFTLVARDLSADSRGPALRVALGSPAHPTPTGAFPLHVVVRNPGWSPGPIARARGATAQPPSRQGPLGVGKIPFAQGGEIALHGGADPLLLGKPVSLGCVRATDEDWLALVAWLEERGALHPPVERPDGERVQRFRRPARLEVR